MNHVTGPEHADDVVPAVRPVVEEVLAQEHQRDRPPQHRHLKGRQFVDRYVDGDDRDLPQGVEGEAAQPHGDTRRGVLGLVTSLVLIPAEGVHDHLHDGQQHEGRYGPQNDIGKRSRHTGTVEGPSPLDQGLLPTSVREPAIMPPRQS